MASGGRFTLGDLGQGAVDAHGGLGRQHDGVVGLAHGTIEDTLEITGAITESDKDQGFALATETVNPAKNFDPGSTMLSTLQIE